VNRKLLATCLAALCLASLILSGCSGDKDPFAYVKVSGKVTYEDGSTLPKDARVNFWPQAESPDGKKYPPVPRLEFDASGNILFRDLKGEVSTEFSLVRGKQKVYLTTPDNKPLAPSALAPEYCDAFKTTLLVDTDQAPFDIKLPKPAPGAGRK
jgi:hypothetical protein